MVSHLDFIAHIRYFNSQLLAHLVHRLDQLANSSLASESNYRLPFNETTTVNDQARTSPLSDGLRLLVFFVGLLVLFVFTLLLFLF